MPSRARDWFAQAERDLEVAQREAAAGSYEWACFAAHQAAEKAVKAVFQSIGAQVVNGHSLREMVTELKRTVPVPAALLDTARILDRYYIPTRYPDAHPSGAPFQFYSKKDANQAVGYAGKLIEFCKSHLS